MNLAQLKTKNQGFVSLIQQNGIDKPAIGFSLGALGETETNETRVRNKKNYQKTRVVNIRKLKANKLGN